MADEAEGPQYARFDTPDGLGVLLDMAGLTACWEGKSKGTLLLLIMGIDEPVAVMGDFNTFIEGHFDHWDLRLKKRPRLKKRGPPVLRVVRPTSYSLSTPREDTP